MGDIPYIPGTGELDLDDALSFVRPIRKDDEDHPLEDRARTLLTLQKIALRAAGGGNTGHKERMTGDPDAYDH